MPAAVVHRMSSQDIEIETKPKIVECISVSNIVLVRFYKENLKNVLREIYCTMG